MPRVHCAFLCALLAGAAQAQHVSRDVSGAAVDTAVPSLQHGDHGAAASWSGHPMLLSAGGRRGEVAFRLSGVNADHVTVFAPGGAPDRLEVDYPVENGQVRIQPAAPMMGNYHWVQARDEHDGTIRVASTVSYFSNPGDAPTALLNRSRSELEIVPQPLPREHAQYRESEKWRFLVRWKGEPLAAQALTLSSEYGSHSTVYTDQKGLAVVVFPRDFGAPKAAPGGMEGHGRERAGFVLSTTHQDRGQTYLTAFNHVYVPEPERSRSLAWGAAFGVLGMVAATPLLRRKENGNG